MSLSTQSPTATSPGGAAGRTLIVVGYDGSPSSRVALAWARTEAEERAARLRVVTTWDESPVDPWTVAQVKEWRAHVRKAAEALSQEAGELTQGRPVELVTVEGSAARVLTGQSSEADLVVVGSSGHVGVLGLLAGSVSRYVLHRAACPVVVVGPEAHPDPVRRLVLSSTLDPAGEVFPWVAQWMSHRAVSVHVVASYAFRTSEDAIRSEPLLEHIGACVAEQNDAWVARLREALPGPADITQVVHHGEVAAVLSSETRERDLLVVPGGSEHALPLAHGRCPIAVVPGPHTAPRGASAVSAGTHG